MPLFSVIIPTYNSEKTLTASLESVVHQTFQDLEVILLDGCSSDRTVEIIKNFAEQYNHIRWISEKDNGIYDAMNKGITMARGKWLYFLGSDDRLYSNNILSIIEDTTIMSKESKLIYGDVFTSAGTIQRYPKYNFTKLSKMNICHQAIFYHRSLFDKFMYDLRYNIFGDWDFNLKVFNQTTAPLYIDQIIVNYNLDGASKNYTAHPEYRKYFLDYKKVIVRYKGYSCLYFFVLKKTLRNLIAWNKE